MSWGFAEGIIFAAVMTMRDMSREREREKKLIKNNNFYQKCYEEIAEESSRACDLISSITVKACSAYVPIEIVNGIRLLPFYCFGQVIRKQGRITSEQNHVMGFYFNHLDLSFSQSQYVNAMIRGNNIGDFRELMELSQSSAGLFWVNLFRALYKAGTSKDFQDIVDSVTGTIMRFSILGNPNSTISLDICNEFVADANYQISHVMDIAVTGIDWLGVVPATDRKEQMRETYYSLIEETDITDTVDENELKELFDLLLLHSICDVVMMTKKPNSVKLQMIHDVLELLEVVPSIPPEQYVKDIANGVGAGYEYSQMFACTKTCGQFWQMLFIMGDKAGRKDETIQFLNALFSILIQVEQYLVDKYQFLGADQIVKKYSTHILASIIATVD